MKIIVNNLVNMGVDTLIDATREQFLARLEDGLCSPAPVEDLVYRLVTAKGDEAVFYVEGVVDREQLDAAAP